MTLPEIEGTRFENIRIGQKFKYKNMIWTKLSKDTAIADGYEASNYMEEDAWILIKWQ